MEVIWTKYAKKDNSTEETDAKENDYQNCWINGMCRKHIPFTHTIPKRVMISLNNLWTFSKNTKKMNWKPDK